MQQYVNSKSFEIIDQDLKRSVNRLNNEFRNSFLHYKPRGWSIEEEAFREIIRDCLPLIEFLLFQSGNICIEPEEESQAKEVITQIKNITRQRKSNQF